MTFTGIRIVNLENQTIQPKQTILINNGSMEVGGHDQSAPDLRDDPVGDFARSFVIPGLQDAYVHIRGGKQAVEANQTWLSRYTAYGVTHIRECSTDMSDEIQTNAVRAATINPATWLGLDDRCGSISPGKSADLVFVENDPEADIKNLRTVPAVVSQGRRVH